MDLLQYYQQRTSEWDEDRVEQYEIKQKKQRKPPSSCLTAKKMALHFNDGDIAVYPHPPVRGIPSHSHNFFELIYVYQGSCINRVDNRAYFLQAGDLCMLNIQAVHQIETEHPENACIFNILVKSSIVDSAYFRLISSEEFVSTFFLDSIQNRRQEKNCVVFCRTGIQGRYESAVHRLIEEYAQHEIYQKEMLYFSFISLLVELTRCYQQQLNNASRRETGRHNLSEIVQYIADHCSTISVQSMAEHFNYHPKYIPNLIRKYSGQSFSELLMDFRLKKSAILLEQTDLPVVQVMEEVGYSNRTWFAQKFRQKFGVTPSQYRKNRK